MFYKLLIGLILISLVIYWIFCFLEIFGLIKFTSKDTEIKVSKLFIPFYYMFKESSTDKTKSSTNTNSKTNGKKK